MALSSPQDAFRLESVSHFLGSDAAAFPLPLPSPDGILRYTRWLERWVGSEAPDTPIEALGAGVVDDIPSLQEYFARNVGFCARLLFCVVAAYCLVKAFFSEAGPRLDAIPDADMEIENPDNVRDAPVLVRLEGSDESLVFLHFKLDVLRAMEGQLSLGAPNTGISLAALFLPHNIDGVLCRGSGLLGSQRDWHFSLNMSMIFDICPWDAYQSLKFREDPGICRTQPGDEDTDDDAAVDIDDDGWTTVVYRNRKCSKQPNLVPSTATRANIRADGRLITLAKTGDDARLRSRISMEAYLNPKKGVLAGRGAVALSSQPGRSVHAPRVRYPAVEPKVLQGMQESLTPSVHKVNPAPGTSQDDREARLRGCENDVGRLDITTMATSPTEGAPAERLILHALGRPGTGQQVSNDTRLRADDSGSLEASTVPPRMHTRAYTEPAASRSSLTPLDQASTQRWPRSALRLPRGRLSTSHYSPNSANWRSRRLAMSSCLDPTLANRTMATSGDSLTCFEVTLYSSSADIILGRHSRTLTGDVRLSDIEVV